jgi:hypothetical protein
MYFDRIPRRRAPSIINPEEKAEQQKRVKPHLIHLPLDDHLAKVRVVSRRVRGRHPQQNEAENVRVSRDPRERNRQPRFHPE